jgi:hypothetical protein
MMAEKSPRVLGHKEVTWCTHESLGAVHVPVGIMYVKTESLEAANREGSPFCQINSEN